MDMSMSTIYTVLAEARNVKMAMIERSEGFEGGKDLG
jgi:hypothetical protein